VQQNGYNAFSVTPSVSCSQNSRSNGITYFHGTPSMTYYHSKKMKTMNAFSDDTTSEIHQPIFTNAFQPKTQNVKTMNGAQSLNKSNNAFADDETSEIFQPIFTNSFHPITQRNNNNKYQQQNRQIANNKFKYDEKTRQMVKFKYDEI